MSIRKPWSLFTEEEIDGPLAHFVETRSWDTKEEILEWFDKGSDDEDCPHRLEKVENTNDVYKLFTAGDVLCCYVSKDREIPQKSEVHRQYICDEKDLTLVEEQPKEGKLIKFNG